MPESYWLSLIPEGLLRLDSPDLQSKGRRCFDNDGFGSGRFSLRALIVLPSGLALLLSADLELWWSYWISEELLRLVSLDLQSKGSGCFDNDGFVPEIVSVQASIVLPSGFALFPSVDLEFWWSYWIIEELLRRSELDPQAESSTVAFFSAGRGALGKPAYSSGAVSSAGSVRSFLPFRRGLGQGLLWF